MKIKKIENGGYFNWLDEDTGVHYQEKCDILWVGELGFCGCGDPEETLRNIREIFKAVKRRGATLRDDKLYYFVCYWADKEGYFEHGTSVFGSWLTDKGEKLLEKINKVLEG